MKTILFAFFLACLSYSGKAADFLDGYLAMANGDTVRCRFKGEDLGRAITFKRVTVINASGKEEAYDAGDKRLLGFGLVNNGRTYVFRYIDVEPKSESGFYQLAVEGRYQLYIHESFAPYQRGKHPPAPTYVLFNPEGAYAFFETCTECPWKTQLRKLFTGNPKALAHLESTSWINAHQLTNDLNRN